VTVATNRNSFPSDRRVYPRKSAGTPLPGDHISARRNTMYIGIGTLVLIILLILLLT
jgi:hypothetical protein